MSIIDTKANRVVGAALKSWPSGYSPGKTEADIPIEQREFDVTIPEGLEETCAEAGNCVSLDFFPLWVGGSVVVVVGERCADGASRLSSGGGCTTPAPSSSRLSRRVSISRSRPTELGRRAPSRHNYALYRQLINHVNPPAHRDPVRVRRNRRKDINHSSSTVFFFHIGTNLERKECKHTHFYTSSMLVSYSSCFFESSPLSSPIAHHNLSPKYP